MRLFFRNFRKKGRFDFMAKNKLEALKAAFPATVPILAGFLFLGITYGIYAHTLGFNFLYPLFMSLTIFAGSMEFVTVNLLLGSFDPFSAFLMALMINERHLFYGIAMLDKFKGTGFKKVYLIYGMCDETFSINCTADIPENIDKGDYMLFVTLLNQLYWVAGATLGGLFGSFLTFDTKGLDFVMTAMFVVIFTEQWMKDEKHLPAFAGLALSVFCLVLFGANDFILPSMLSILAFLTLTRRVLDKEETNDLTKGADRS